MEIDWAVWGPPLAVLVAGAALGVVSLRRLGESTDDARIAAEARRIDLASARDEVVHALKDLDVEKDKLDPAEYQRERDLLLARGARALEGLESDGVLPTRSAAPAPAAPVPVVATAPAPGLIAPEWRGALYMLGAICLVGLMVWLAGGDSRLRNEGDSMTGGTTSMGAPRPGAPQGDPTDAAEFKARAAELLQQLEANPNDLGALNAISQLYLSHGDPKNGMVYNDKALAIAPKDLDARTYRAVLGAMMGLFDKALVGLDEVLAEDPAQTKALTYKGLILLEMERPAEAIPVLEEAARRQPENRVLPQAVAEARQRAGLAPAPAPAGGDRLVAGTITIDPAAAATLKGGETLFISISDPAKPMPPVAADSRRGPLTFPMPFELTTAHIRAMPGSGMVPAVLDLKVRVDIDGNAMTREAGTPIAVVTSLNKGTGGLDVHLTLDGAAVVAPAGAAAPTPPQPGGGLLAPIEAPSPSAAAGGEFFIPGSQPGELLVSGTATVDASRAASLTGAEVVFVSVRDPAGGAPLASRKLAAKFPLPFSIAVSDVIAMGADRPVPSTFNVTIRVDVDGDALSKEGEPEGIAQGVARGTSGLALLLK